jgi:ribonuclease P protein component
VLNSQITSLKGRDNFKRMSKLGDNQVTPFFVFVKTSSIEQKLRLGIIATRKIGNAVTRNKIRRVVKEAFRCYVKNNIVPAIDCIIILRKKSTFVSNKKLRNDLDILLEKITTHENSN